MNRRGFLFGAGTAGLLIAAPSIVRAGSLMPVKAPREIDVGEFIGDLFPDIDHTAQLQRIFDAVDLLDKRKLVLAPSRAWIVKGTVTLPENATIDLGGNVFIYPGDGLKHAPSLTFRKDASQSTIGSQRA